MRATARPSAASSAAVFALALGACGDKDGDTASDATPATDAGSPDSDGTADGGDGTADGDEDTGTADGTGDGTDGTDDGTDGTDDGTDGTDDGTDGTDDGTDGTDDGSDGTDGTDGTDDGGGDDAGEGTDDGGDDAGASTGTDSGGGSGGSGSGSGSGGSGGSGSGGSTDSDGDGQTDADELAAGTDPLDFYDRSYSGGYNVASCGSALPTASTPSGTHNGRATTYALGDVVANVQLVDQHGENVDLYSFCDNHIMLVFSAMWCGSCQSVARNAQSKQTTHGASGFQYLEVLVEDRSAGSIDTAELNQWATSYGLSTVPVLDDDARAAHVLFERNWSYPTIVHLGAGTMEVLSIDAGEQDPSGWL